MLLLAGSTNQVDDEGFNRTVAVLIGGQHMQEIRNSSALGHENGLDSEQQPRNS